MPSPLLWALLLGSLIVDASAEGNPLAVLKPSFASFIVAFGELNDYEVKKADDARVEALDTTPHSLEEFAHRVQTWVHHLEGINTIVQQMLANYDREVGIEEESRQIVFKIGLFCRRRLSRLRDPRLQLALADIDPTSQATYLSLKTIEKEQGHFKQAVRNMRRLVSLESSRGLDWDNCLISLCVGGLILLLVTGIAYLYRSQPNQGGAISREAFAAGVIKLVD